MPNCPKEFVRLKLKHNMVVGAVAAMVVGATTMDAEEAMAIKKRERKRRTARTATNKVVVEVVTTVSAIASAIANATMVSHTARATTDLLTNNAHPKAELDANLNNLR